MKWCISDIHGCANTLKVLLEKVISEDSNASFVFGGDYIDRGMHSKQVIDILLELKKFRECHFLRGNHEDMFMSWYDGSSWDDVAQGLYRYLVPTLQSYGLTFSDQDKVPQEHVEFFKSLKPIHIDDNFFAVHAWFFDQPIPRDERFLSLNNEMKAQMIWGRYQYSELELERTWGMPGVFGHTPACNYGSPGAPKLTKWIKLIDAGSFVSVEQGGGNICAYCPETDKYVITPTLGIDLEMTYDGRRRV